MKKIVLLGALFSALFAGCSSSTESELVTETPEIPESTQIPINISMGIWTRATDSSFENGDKVGVYVVNYKGSTAGSLTNTGNHVDNMRFTFSSKWTPDKEIYWADKNTKADFYCYYPYGTPTNVAAYDFSVKADQSLLANYKASDFLWGKASGVSPTASAVPITTNHIMSNMLIYIKPGEGFTEETFAAVTKSVKICNVKTGATINLATGVATAKGTAAEVTPYNEGEYYRALVVPQSVSDGSNLITVIVDGVNYTFAKGFTFKANTQHKFTVTVNKVNNGVNIGIGGWEVDEEDNGGSAE